MNLQPLGSQPYLEPFIPVNETRRIGDTIERAERRYRPGILGLSYARMRIPPEWTMKRQMLTPHYTTRWDELPIAVA